MNTDQKTEEQSRQFKSEAGEGFDKWWIDMQGNTSFPLTWNTFHASIAAWQAATRAALSSGEEAK